MGKAVLMRSGNGEIPDKLISQKTKYKFLISDKFNGYTINGGSYGTTPVVKLQDDWLLIVIYSGTPYIVDSNGAILFKYGSTDYLNIVRNINSVELRYQFSKPYYLESFYYYIFTFQIQH